MRLLNMYKSLLLLFFCGVSLSALANFQPVKLTCEYKENPLGIENIQPRFGWWINATGRGVAQSGYQICIASSIQHLNSNHADIWDSGKMMSDSNFLVTYKGPLLQSARKYFWKVRIWDQSGKVSGWSSPATFVTGLLSQQAWHNAYWIAYENLPDSLKIVPGKHIYSGADEELKNKAVKRAIIPCFRKSFTLEKKVAQAYVFVSGLGQYELHMNGAKVSNDFMTPGWTNYATTCLYNTYDVTNQLREGENIIGGLVGTGFLYINRERYRKMDRAEGYSMLRLKLMVRFTDGTSREITTDESWKTAPSAIIYSSIYGGEDYDAQMEQPGWNQSAFNDSHWKHALQIPGTGGRMQAQIEYPLQVMNTVTTSKLTSPVHGKYVYDFGQNSSGIIKLRIKGEKGKKVKIIPGELLDNKGLVSQGSSGGPFYFEYTLKGDGEEEWQPRFTYYGFRYAMVEGATPVGKNSGNEPQVKALKFLQTRNSAPTAGSFSCSDTLFNKIYTLIDWALRSNMASVSTDCPHREKLGWLEQAYLMGESLKYNYDIFHFYHKITDDMIAAQLPNGMMPSIAPEYVIFDGPFRDDPGYGSAAVIVPWYLYKWYGDKTALVKSYDMVKRYVTYLGTQAQNNILSYGLGDWLDLGPNPPGVSQLTPVSLAATAIYYYDVHLLSKMAEVLGKEEDVKTYVQLEAAIKHSFNDKYFNPVTNVYGTGSQSSYAMPLWMGLVNEDRYNKVLHNLTDSIHAKNNIITAGDVGHRYLVKALEEGGANDLLFKMNNREDVPGYGYQIRNGATALTEYWSGANTLSHNHMILGHLMEWFYSGLAGIRQQDDDAGYRKTIIAPLPVGNLTWVKTSYNTTCGTIEVHWKKEVGKFILQVQVPANTVADIILPVANVNQVMESGRTITNQKWVKQITQQQEKVSISVSSGKYIFVCKL